VEPPQKAALRLFKKLRMTQVPEYMANNMSAQLVPVLFKRGHPLKGKSREKTPHH
jgi:hypothetical protein